MTETIIAPGCPHCGDRGGILTGPYEQHQSGCPSLDSRHECGECSGAGVRSCPCGTHRILRKDPHDNIVGLTISHDGWCPAAKPTPTLDGLLGPEPSHDYSDRPF
jgi:hypothetical protein